MAVSVGAAEARDREILQPGIRNPSPNSLLKQIARHNSGDLFIFYG